MEIDDKVQLKPQKFLWTGKNHPYTWMVMCTDISVLIVNAEDISNVEDKEKFRLKQRRLKKLQGKEFMTLYTL